jgi:hypothetical protein
MPSLINITILLKIYPHKNTVPSSATQTLLHEFSLASVPLHMFHYFQTNGAFTNVCHNFCFIRNIFERAEHMLFWILLYLTFYYLFLWLMLILYCVCQWHPALKSISPRWNYVKSATGYRNNSCLKCNRYKLDFVVFHL